MQYECIIFSFVAWLALQYFSTLSRKRYDVRGGGKLLKIKFRSSLQILSEIFLIRRKLQRDMIKNTHSSSRKVPVILV
jgi:hypothetical protein